MRKLKEDIMDLIEVRLNTHQEHLEHLIFLSKEEMEEMNRHIENFIAQMKGEDRGQNTTVKIDGAPAVICWSSIYGHPDNSINLKAFVNGPKNDLSTPEEIEAKYTSADGKIDADRADMIEELKYCLKYIAPQIPAGEAWQGDCLFVKSTKEKENIGGVDCITFTPNTIKYAFTENSPYYEKVKNADFGIALHTRYSINDNGELRQSFKIDPSQINVPDNICILPHNITVDNSKINLEALENKYAELKELEGKIVDDPDYVALLNNETFCDYWTMYENSRTSDFKQATFNLNEFFEDLVQFIKDKKRSALDTKIYGKNGKGGWAEKNRTPEKISAATDKSIEETNQIIEIFQTNKPLLINMVKCFNCAVECKTMIWNGYKDVPLGYDTYAEHRVNGWFHTNMEGIAMSDSDGNIVKVVDRPGFSNLNRDPNIVKGFERHKVESLEEDISQYKDIIDKAKQKDFSFFCKGTSKINLPSNVWNLVYDTLFDTGKDHLFNTDEEFNNYHNKIDLFCERFTC